MEWNVNTISISGCWFWLTALRQTTAYSIKIPISIFRLCVCVFRSCVFVTKWILDYQCHCFLFYFIIFFYVIRKTQHIHTENGKDSKWILTPISLTEKSETIRNIPTMQLMSRVQSSRQNRKWTLNIEHETKTQKIK